MKVLVTGGCGFIGSHVVDTLLERGIRVRVVDRGREMFRDPLPSVEYVTGDFSDSALISEALMGVDAVIHLASTTVPASSNIDPIADITGNLIGTMKLIEGMRAVGVKNLVYTSSGGTVYGNPQTDPIPEDHPLQPISSYGIIKSTIEKYLFMENHLHGLRYCALRASNPYGPRQGHRGVQGVIGTYLWRIVKNEPIEVWGDGSTVRDFIYIRDLADLCVTALASSACGVFNAGQGQGASILEIIEMIQNTTGKKLTPVFRAGRDFDVPRVILDISRAQQTFDWVPKLDLQSGIDQTWDWVLRQV
jgi:Nucleoside-diphosphate-sugar epimerases